MNNSVHDSAVTIVLTLNFFLVAIAAGAFGFLLRASLNCLNPVVVQNLSKDVPRCGFLSTVHVVGVLVFVLYFSQSIVIFFITDFMFSQSPMNCNVVNFFSVTAFAGAKFAQYTFFILRLQFVFRHTEDSSLHVSTWTVRSLIGAVAVYAAGFEAITGFYALFETETALTIPGGVANACIRKSGISPLLAVSVAWFMLFDTGCMIAVLYQFLSRLLKMGKAPSLEDEIILSTAWRTFGMFVVTAASAIALGIVELIHPNDLLWFAVPNYDMFVNCMVIAITEFITFGADGLLKRDDGFQLLYASPERELVTTTSIAPPSAQDDELPQEE